MMSLWPCRWGELLRAAFHGCGTCLFASPLLHCQKGDVFRRTGAGFRESNTFAAQLHRNLQCQSGVLRVLNCPVTFRFAIARLLQKCLFRDMSQVKRRFVRVEIVKTISKARTSYPMPLGK